MKFTIPGTPVAKGRPRTGRYGTYTPQKTVEYENLVKIAAPQGEPLQGALRARIELYFPIPKSKPKKQREAMQAGEIRPTKKPDCDNCIKSITDALNGIAYTDDSQIVSIECEKWYSDRPRAEVMIDYV